MEQKHVSQTSVTMAQVMQPEDANPAGNVHGGVIMKLIDNAAYVVASRHARRNTVTASIDRMSFYCPVFVGDLLFLKASINMASRSSMEIGVRVEAENFITGELRHTASAYLTFVAIDEKGKPVSVPPLTLDSEEQVRRNREALDRRASRLKLRSMESMSQKKSPL